MIVNGNLGGVNRVPIRKAGCKLVASIDVEWTKNYQIKNGNIPFCWSVTWLQVPNSRDALVPTGFNYTSAYVRDGSETQELISTADAEIAVMLDHADIVIGHQVSSDLSVLRNASRCMLPALEMLRSRWHRRRDECGAPVVVDTRYDTDGVLSGTSRRLVDVCTELGLDVTQPELARTSMTALHRVWLDDRNPSARERITVLNLRHGLSAAYVALRSADLGRWHPCLNVNQILDQQLNGAFAWLADPKFRELL